ncbi:MAG: glycosyltransferase family 1 protein [Myxococcales bacterium FL481]|nr:MAG: glycosyltransferase family 1 protein [Myxococcales bacterium FL481]
MSCLTAHLLSFRMPSPPSQYNKFEGLTRLSVSPEIPSPSPSGPAVAHPAPSVTRTSRPHRPPVRTQRSAYPRFGPDCRSTCRRATARVQHARGSPKANTARWEADSQARSRRVPTSCQLVLPGPAADGAGPTRWYVDGLLPWCERRRTVRGRGPPPRGTPARAILPVAIAQRADDEGQCLDGSPTAVLRDYAQLSTPTLMPIRRLSCFLPRETPFYANLLRQIQRGFEQCGIECSGALRLLDPAELRQWCREVRPDVVLEMNRARNAAEGLPPDVKHIVWLVDLAGRPADDYRGSDITYFFGPAWGLDISHEGYRRCLVPGSCVDDYPHRPATHEFELSFAGHIPGPWTPEELERDLTSNPGELSFGEFLPAYECRLHEIWDAPLALDDNLHHGLRYSRKRVRRPDSRWNPLTVAKEVVTRLCGGELNLADDRLRYDVIERARRHLNRGGLAQAMLSTGRSVAFYGSSTWSEWSAFASSYRGWLEGPRQLGPAYAGSTINMHEGEGVHFRSMDVMATGGLLAFRQTARDSSPGGIASMFEPGVHYLPFKIEELTEAVGSWLDQPDRLNSIRHAAATEIRARHTWRHRAESILVDLDRVG